MSRSPVEQRAEREGLRTVRLTRHDLLSVLTGDPMMCSDDTGAEVAVRLFTADELIEARNASVAMLRESIPDLDPPPLSRELAERPTEPVPDAFVWGGVVA